MPLEQEAVDAAFASEIGRDADYFKAPGPAVKVRVIPTTRDLRRDLVGQELQGRQRLLDVRVSDVPAPAPGDTLTLYIEDTPDVWVPGPETLKIVKKPDRPDRLGLVWTLDMQPVVP